MHEKIHEKVLQLDLFADMQITPLPSKVRHPHDVKFRGIVFNALTSKNIQKKEKKMVEVLLVISVFVTTIMLIN
jgi:hypothetical protein